MIKINEHFLKLQSSYLFSEIAKRVNAHQANHPDQAIIKLGIGDATQPLCPACLDAFHKAVDEMGTASSFRGYGPEQGYAFLREAVADNDYQARGADIQPDEVFISDGAKCDTGNFQELFATDIRVAIPDPVYPVYLDTNVMAGRTGAFENGRYGNIVYMDCTAQNSFLPAIPKEPADLVYLCFPNNPTGAVATKEYLQAWVDWALDAKALILFDAAYEAFIRDSSIPKTIYEIPGARKVAVEFRSFSKTAGFTGTRCAFSVVPKECMAYDADGKAHALHALWNRRHCTKFNGVSYPVQRAAEAVYSPEGKAQAKEMINTYMANADRITAAMAGMGFSYVGGDHSPYIWVDTKTDSWAFFDTLLTKAGVVCTPGGGFGKCGAQYIRLSAFNSYANVDAAMKRMAEVFGKA
jgi:LL-diaminopimelate aminotransferase